jgi:hypothetical protein
MSTATQIEQLASGLSSEIAELEKLFTRLPDVITKKRAQLSKLQEVAKIMSDGPDADDDILQSLMGLSAAPVRVSSTRRTRGPNLPTRVMTLLTAAGPRGMEFRGILGKLEEVTGGEVNRSHLTTTLKRLLDRRKIEKIADRFRVA